MSRGRSPLEAEIELLTGLRPQKGRSHGNRPNPVRHRICSVDDGWAPPDPRVKRVVEPAGIEPATSSMPRKRAPAAPRPHVFARSRGTGEGYQRWLLRGAGRLPIKRLDCTGSRAARMRPRETRACGPLPRFAARWLAVDCLLSQVVGLPTGSGRADPQLGDRRGMVECQPLGGRTLDRLRGTPGPGGGGQEWTLAGSDG